MTTETLAQNLYETYCKAAGGKAANGADFPLWSVLLTDPASKIPANWRAVAETVVPKSEVIGMGTFVETALVDLFQVKLTQALDNTAPVVDGGVYATPPPRKGRPPGSKNAPADV